MTFRFAGYSIIEMAIALVVLGLLLGAAAVPLQQRFEAEDRNETEEILEDAAAAVVGFAVANRTVQRTVIGHDGVHYNLPSGRPYLPCPDISGDGVENRTTVTVALLATIDITSPVLVSEGVCDESKGLLPWRTLGLRGASDPWGRRIGYRVDIAYSSEVMGFDETFRADIFDPRLGVTLDANGVEFYQPRASRNEVGALVCTEIAKTVGCPVLAANMPNLVAGVVTTISINLGAREFPAYADINGADPVQGVLDGAVFVVYSHGKNGKGGISSQNDGPNNRCLDFQDDPGDTRQYFRTRQRVLWRRASDVSRAV